MDGPRPGGGETDTDLAGELGVGARHEGRELLVAGLDEADLVLALGEGAHDPVDPVAGIAVDALDAPIDEALDEVIGDGSAHGSVLGRSGGRMVRGARRFEVARRFEGITTPGTRRW